MSLQIAVAHTGQRLDADPLSFSTIDALKHWISTATEVPSESQILLTTRGKHVKAQALLTEVGEKPVHLFGRANYFAEADIRIQPRALCRVPVSSHPNPATGDVHARRPSRHTFQPHRPASMANAIPGPP
jgi:hypothetical protein